jgi:glycosyltransferase involved in cell wall biosynthesis
LNILITRSNPISPDPRVEKIARVLGKTGYSVLVLGWDRTASLPEKEILENFTIHRLQIRAEFGKGMENLPNLLKWQWGLLGWLIKYRKTYDVIHACDFDTILPALLMKLLLRKRMIYDIFDFFADHLRATPKMIKGLIRRVDLWAIGKVDALILVDDARLVQIVGSKPHLISVIYNSPEDVGETLFTTGSTQVNGFRLAYIGLLQVERGLLEMIDVLRQHQDWHLDLAGFGGDQELILDSIAGMANIQWHGRVKYQRALQLNAAADVLFATYDPAIPNHKYSSPNKIFEAMMLGKPIIVCADTNMDRMVEEADCGCIVPYGDIPALEKTLQSLATDAELLRRLGQNARKAYDTKYHWSIMSQKLIQLYEKVLE